MGMAVQLFPDLACPRRGLFGDRLQVVGLAAQSLGDGLSPVLRGLDAARSAVAAQRLALRGALLYNAAAVALALTGRVDPLVAALLMPLSNLAVLWVCGRPLRQAAP